MKYNVQVADKTLHKLQGFFMLKDYKMAHICHELEESSPLTASTLPELMTWVAPNTATESHQA